MAERKEEVMRAVEQALEKDPSAELTDLYEMAKSVDPAVGELTLRQFNARYPLQVKRKRSGARPGRKPGRTRTRTRRARRQASDQREALRKLFYEFAQELAEASNKSEVVGALARVDDFAQRAEGLFKSR